MADCLNCGQFIKPQHKFCSKCGQKAHIHRITIGHILHDIVHFLTHADKGIFHLLKMLAVQPGKTIREYIEGKRKKYFGALNFFLIAIAMFVFVLTTLKPMQAVNLSQAKESVKMIPEKEVRDRRLIKLERIENASNFMAKYSNFINFIITPLAALIFFLFYYRSGFNYAEHLVANLYIAGFNALVFIFIFVPFFLLTKGSAIYFFGVFAFLIWEAVYRGVAYYHFINKKGIQYLIYPILISSLIVIGWYKLSTSLITYYIERGF